MAKTNLERLKRIALLGFVAVSIGLIILIWADGLTPDAPSTPSYYRDTFQIDEDVYLTVTAEFIEYQENLSNGTPAPTHAPDEHDGAGGGQGRGQGQDRLTTPQPGE